MMAVSRRTASRTTSKTSLGRLAAQLATLASTEVTSFTVFTNADDRIGMKPTSMMRYRSGAVGSALFDAAGKLLALHHLGHEVNNQCTPTKRSNKAVGMDAILDDLKFNDAPVYQELMAHAAGIK